MEDEFVLIGNELVFARLSSNGSPWPALSYTATHKAEEHLSKYSKFFEGGKLISA